MTNAPSTFVTYMKEVFDKNKENQAPVYLEDIIAYRITRENIIMTPSGA